MFADIGVNEDRDVRSLVGLKFYLSREEKSLIRRHREDDPDVDLPTDLFRAIQARPPPPVVTPIPTPTPIVTNQITCPEGQKLINGSCDGNT